MADETTPNEQENRYLTYLKAIEDIADKSSSIILYTVGMAILALSYFLRYFAPSPIRTMDAPEFMFSCSLAFVFIASAAVLRLYIHQLSVDRVVAAEGAAQRFLADTAKAKQETGSKIENLAG